METFMPISYWLPVADEVEVQLLADVQALCPAAALDAAQVRMRKRELSFYTFVALYELEVLSNHSAPSQLLGKPQPNAGLSRTYVLWGPAILQPLDGTETPIYTLNKELLAVGAFVLTAANASEYLAFILSMCTKNQVMQLLGSLVPLGRDDDRVPLETRLVPLQVLELSDGLFESQVLVQAGSDYYARTINFERDGELKVESTPVAGTYPPLPTLEEHRPGEQFVLQIPEQQAESYDRTGIISGRQALREIAADYAPTGPALAGQTVDFAWNALPPHIHNQLIKSLADGYRLPLQPTQCQSRVLALPFYDLLNLYEVTTIDPGLPVTESFVPQRYYILWAKQSLWQAEGPMLELHKKMLLGLLLPLNKTNGPIYQVNEELSRVGGLRLTAETVPAYVRFFFGHVAGKHGYFNIVDNLRLRLREGEAEKPLPGLQAYDVQLPPLKAIGQPNEPYQVRVYIEFKGHFFSSNVLVQPDGTTSLNNEKLLGTVISPVTGRPDYTKLEVPSENHSRRSLLELRLDAPRLAIEAARQQAEATTAEAAADTDKTATGEAANKAQANSARASKSFHINPEAAGLALTPGAEFATWQLLTAEAFLAALQADTTHGESLANSYITGQVILTEATFRQGIRLQNCYFEERVSCDASTRQAAFRAEQCFFRGGISFERGWTGAIHLKACKLFQAVSLNASRDPFSGKEATTKPLLTISGLDIAGNVELDSVWIAGTTDLTETTCGRLTINGCLLENKFNARMLRSRGIDLATQGMESPGILANNQLREVSFNQAWVEGDVKVTGTGVGLLDLTNATVTGNITLSGLGSGAVSGSNVRCDALEISDVEGAFPGWGLDFNYLHATRVLIQRVALKSRANTIATTALEVSESQHWFSFNDAVLEGRFYLSEVAVAGDLTFTGLKAADIYLEKVKTLAYKTGAALPIANGHLFMSQTMVSGDVTIGDTHVAGELGMQDLKLDGQLKLVGLHVGGDLLLRRSAIQRGIRMASWYADAPEAIQGVTVGGNLNMKRVQAGAVRISSCTIGGTFNAIQARFDSLEFWLGLKQRPHQTLDERYYLCQSHVGSNVRLNGTVVLGNLDWVGVGIAGKYGFVARMLQVQGNMRFAIEEEELQKLVVELYREQLQSRDAVLYEAADTATKRLLTNLPGYQQDAFATQFRATIAGDVDLEALRLEGSLDLSETRVQGSIKLGAAVINGGLTIVRTEVRQSLDMSRCVVKHDFIVSYLRVLAQAAPPQPGQEPTEPRADLTALTVGGLFRFRATQFNCSLNLTDANLLRGLHAALPETDTPETRPPHPALKIKGDLILKSAISQENIDLTDTLLVQKGLRYLCVKFKPNHSASIRLVPFKRAPGLLAAGITVEGVLRLADVEASRQLWALRIPGCIDLSRAKLQELTFSNESHPTNRSQSSRGKIYILKSLRKRPIVNSSRSSRGKTWGTDAPILLDNAHVGILTVQKPPPSPMSLQGLSVQKWSFRLPKDGNAAQQGQNEIKKKYGDMPDNAAEYVWFLDQSPEVQKSLYRAVEKQLYDEGNEKASDAVYRVMWLRDHWAQWRAISWTSFWSILSLSSEWLLNQMFGYFTYVPKLMSIALFAWFCMSVVIFSHRRNIVPSGPALEAAHSRLAALPHTSRLAPDQQRQRQADSLLLPTSHPPATWGAGDGVLMALRYHLPFVPITPHEVWAPARQAQLRFMPRLSTSVQAVASFLPAFYTLPTSPASYATLVAWLHWLIIPILGIIISRRILKRAKQG